MARRKQLQTPTRAGRIETAPVRKPIVVPVVTSAKPIREGNTYVIYPIKCK